MLFFLIVLTTLISTGETLMKPDLISGASGTRSPNDWVGKKAPEISQGEWINSKPLKLAELRGQVVMLEFWTFGCWNCRNTLPFVKTWHKKYSGERFAIIGIHTPEFESEKNLSKVRSQVSELGIQYPVVTDNDSKTWDSYEQMYWPVLYLIDKKGVIRYVHIGEGEYEQTEEWIKKLLRDS